jgi:WD40 repeat protein
MKPNQGGSRLITGSLDKTIKIWKDDKVMESLTEHSDWIRCISLSSDNKYLASGCVSSKVYLWDLETLKVLSIVENPSKLEVLLFYSKKKRLIR